MATQQKARPKRSKAPDKRPAHQRYTAQRRWLRNKARRMARTLRAQPNNQQLTERIVALCKLEPVAFRP